MPQSQTGWVPQETSVLEVEGARPWGIARWPRTMLREPDCPTWCPLFSELLEKSAHSRELGVLVDAADSNTFPHICSTAVTEAKVFTGPGACPRPYGARSRAGL